MNRNKEYTESLELHIADLEERLAKALTLLAIEHKAEYMVTSLNVQHSPNIGIAQVRLELIGNFEYDKLEDLIGHKVHIVRTKI
jgi:hypothetical protein